MANHDERPNGDPGPPMHPPSGGDVPGWLEPASPDTASDPVTAATFVDSSGKATGDVFSVDHSYTSPEEVVRINFKRLKKKNGWKNPATARRLTYACHGKDVWTAERVKRIENGRKKKFSIAELFLFCHAFEVPIWELILPRDGDVVAYSNNLVGRDQASELLFFVPSLVFDGADPSEDLAAATKEERDRRWREQWGRVEDTLKAQFDEFMKIQHDEFLKEMQALADQEGGVS